MCLPRDWVNKPFAFVLGGTQNTRIWGVTRHGADFAVVWGKFAMVTLRIMPKSDGIPL
jgi:hypothetical protein